MAKFKGIVALKKEDLDALFKTGLVTLEDGTEIAYDSDTVYITEEDVEQIARDRISTDFAEAERQRTLSEGDIIHAKVIYRADGGESLDWGMSGGIFHGSSVSGKDFTKGKKLICFLRCGSQRPVVEIDLTAPSTIVGADSVYNGTACAYYVESLGHLLISINVSNDKTSLAVEAKYSLQSSSDFCIYQIVEEY